MPPHCDSMDGPVVTAAKRALDARDARIALAYVPKQGEEEVRRAFEAAVRIRDEGPAVRDVADLHFFETVVRVHRSGEGAPYTGLKPAGLDHGPVIPVAEQAIASGSPEALVELLATRVEEEVRERFAHVMALQARADGDLDANRAYVAAMLDLQVWSHGMYQATRASAHEHKHVHAD
jgi:Family of unknown function (DUF6448)